MLEEITTLRNAEKIREYFGDEAESIIENLEIERLLEIPGFGRKTATDILMRAHERKTGERFEDILCGDALKVYDRIVAYLQEFPVTSVAKNKFLVHFPSSDKSLLEKRYDYCGEAKKFTEELGEEKTERLMSALKNIRKLSEREPERIRDRIILCDSEETLEKIKNPYCDALLVESSEDLSSAKGYSLLFYVYKRGSERYDKIAEISDYEIHEGDFKLETVVPESRVELLFTNRKTIETLCEIGRILGGDETLEQMVSMLSEEEGEVFSKKRLSEIVSEAEREANRKFEERIEEEKMALDGKEILKILAGMRSDPESAIKGYLPKSVEKIYDEITLEANRLVSEALGFDVEIFRDEISFPVEIVEERLEEISETLSKKKAKETYLSKKRLLSLAGMWDYVKKKEGEAYELDFMVAMGRIILKNKMTRPEMIAGGLSFRQGKSLFIKDCIPVDYKVGETPHDFVGNENVIVLTGANSGGKTTLLETMLQSQILAQMGFYVPCFEFYTTPFSEINYITKPRAQDAGAFESSLKSLVPLALTDKKKLVLIDELEAITEPGSAAKIISSFLNLLLANRNTLAVIVSHLGEDIMKHTGARCDGIEASGLTETLELEVNRQPIFHRLGRSTPELIVEKLARRSTGKEKEVYRQMLEDIKKI